MKNGLTAKQEEALDVVRRLSPGYELTVTTYDDGSTHVFVYDENEEQVALVGKKVQQYYDGKKETEQVVRRVANRVYRDSGFTFN